MYGILMTVLAIISVLIIFSVLLQPSKNSSSLMGGSEELFARRKARGFEAVMQRFTFILLALFFIISAILMYLTYKGI